MNTLFLHEDRHIEQEANELRQIVEEHTRLLRENHLGKKFTLGPASFQVAAKDRNIVYRVQLQSRWYLKLPCNANQKNIEKEILSLRFIHDVLKSDESYLFPSAVRASVRDAYVLSAEVPGESLSRELYRRCFFPSHNRKERIEKLFYTLGRILARLHKDGVKFDETALRMSLYGSLQSRIAKVTERDTLSKDIIRWFETTEISETERTFVHGNCVLKNILAHHEKLSLVNYEACGAGSQYNDLATVCGNVILSRTVFGFPWKRAYSALSLLLDGYKERYSFEPEILFKYVALYIFGRYIQIYFIKKTKDTSCVTRVFKTRLQWLVRKLLADDMESVFANIKVHSALSKDSSPWGKSADAHLVVRPRRP